MTGTVFTIGHSLHDREEFISMLKRHGVTAIGDVRSRPYSRMAPQYNREELKPALRAAGIQYVFLGAELGARSDDPSVYLEGKVQYDRLARTERFQRGLRRVQEGMTEYTVALMCAEKEPLACHRTILVSRHLTAVGIPVVHIHADGSLESHSDAMDRLVRALKISTEHWFRSREEVLDDAYQRQGERVAYESEEDTEAGSVAGSSYE